MKYELIVNGYANHLRRLRESYIASLSENYATIDRRTAVVCIEALNSYSEFSRKTIECVMNNGTCNNVTIGWNNQAGSWIEIASRCVKPHFVPGRRNEPKWFEPYNILTVANNLQFGNLAKIQSALSTQSRVLLDLPCVRNFYAHRNESTKHSAKMLYLNNSASFQAHPTRLMSYQLNNGRHLLEDWLLDLEYIILMHI